MWGIIDKWVLRKVAARYIPAGLSYRKKIGFPINVQNRLKVKAAFLNRSFFSDSFSMRQQEIQFMIDHSDQKLKQKLFHLEVWAQVCLLGQPERQIADKIREYCVVSAC